MDDTDIRKLKERNSRVEADKAWETSWARRLSIAVMTYVVAVFYMHYAGLSNPMLGAFVPCGGYLLSTMSLPFIRNFWLRNIYKHQES